jgi:DNA invertase Pin-like site-specific DNA recombinase
VISDKGASFKSLGDPWADTTTPHGKLMITVLGGRAEFERHLILSRTSEGRQRAIGGAFNGPAPSLAKTERPFDAFKAQLRDMPAYSTAVLSDQEIADMYAFVQSLPAARSAKDISILND